MINSSVGIRPRSQPTHDWVKRVADVVIGCAIVALTLPLLGLVALTLRCESKGPVFVRRERIGAAGRPIHLLVFRTAAHEPGRVPYLASPPTAIGRLLRYTRLNQLPEALHLIRGDLTLFERRRCARLFA